MLLQKNYHLLSRDILELNQIANQWVEDIDHSYEGGDSPVAARFGSGRLGAALDPIHLYV